MLNNLRKFIRKQITAVALAKYDLLFLLKGLFAFKYNIKPASFFVKPSPLSIPQRVQKFLEYRQNGILNLLVDELSADVLYKTDKLFYLKEKANIVFNSEAPFMSVQNIYDKKYSLYLFQEIIAKDFPQFSDQYAFFKKRLDLASDMRLYAAELQELLDKTIDSEAAFPIEIDWIKTDKDNLYLNASDKFVFTQNLSPKAQENFCRLFLSLLFEKSLFISSWNGVAADSSDKVNILNFDAVYEASVSLKKFALDSNRKVTTLAQLKLYRALKLLEIYCPDVKVEKFIQSYIGYPLNESENIKNERQNFLNLLQQNGFDFGVTKNAPEFFSPKSKRLSDTKKHLSDSLFGKSSVYYWGPLVLAAFILYIFYNHE